MLGFSWLKSDISKSCDTPYATPFMADTAPSWVPKSVRRTKGARACASVEKNNTQMSTPAPSATAPGEAVRGAAASGEAACATTRRAATIAAAAAMAALARQSDAPGVRRLPDDP